MFFLISAWAGFPSPAEDYEEVPLDLNTYLIAHPAATFLVRVRGHSMQQAGILAQDILVVDRALSVKSGQIVVAVLNGQFYIKRFCQHGAKVWLESAHPDYTPRPIRREDQFEIWGVAVHVLRRLV